MLLIFTDLAKDYTTNITSMFYCVPILTMNTEIIPLCLYVVYIVIF